MLLPFKVWEFLTSSRGVINGGYRTSLALSYFGGPATNTNKPSRGGINSGHSTSLAF